MGALYVYEASYHFVGRRAGIFATGRDRRCRGDPAHQPDGCFLAGRHRRLFVGDLHVPAAPKRIAEKVTPVFIIGEKLSSGPRICDPWYA